MQILFTTSNYPTSYLIRKITGDDCSHVALFFEEDQCVVHCNFLGMQRESKESFIKHNQIIHTIHTTYNKTSIEVYEQYKGVKYDYAALLYLGLRYLCRLLPKANLWQSSNLFLCTEFVTEVLEKTPDSLVTPHQLYNKMT